MKRSWLVISLGLLLLFACSPVSTPPPAATAIIPSPTVAPPQDTAAPTVSPPTATLAPVETTAPPSFLLAEPGPYFAGNREYTFIDESRAGREIEVLIWYPALEQKDAYDRMIVRDAAPDTSGAPYPLILVEPNTGSMLFTSHLATHGFTMAVVRFPDEYDILDYGVVDHPRDMVFALEQIASQPLEGLESMIDTDNVGVTGYSWGGFYSLAVSGVRIDPVFYRSYCEQAPEMQPELPAEYLEYACNLAQKWDEFAAHVGEEITASEDGLWQPVTDERIRAVMPMATDGAWLYGERGLAPVDRPLLFIQASEDSPYQRMEAEFIYDNLGTRDKSMISFVGKDHMMVFDTEEAQKMKHFAVAFFGYHLQGREDFADYFSKDFVELFDDLAWGVYPEK